MLHINDKQGCKSMEKFSTCAGRILLITHYSFCGDVIGVGILCAKVIKLVGYYFWGVISNIIGRRIVLLSLVVVSSMPLSFNEDATIEHSTMEEDRLTGFFCESMMSSLSYASFRCSEILLSIGDNLQKRCIKNFVSVANYLGSNVMSRLLTEKLFNKSLHGDITLEEIGRSHV